MTSADLVVVCLGTGTDVEREGHDRATLDLPGSQLDLLKDAVAAGIHSLLLFELFCKNIYKVISGFNIYFLISDRSALFFSQWEAADCAAV